MSQPSGPVQGLGGWGYALARVTIALAIGAALGLFVGNFWAGLSGALATYLGFQLVQLFRLEYWLRHRNVSDPPDAGGLWGDVVAQVVRLHRRKNFHKKRLIEIFRELRRAAAEMPDGAIILNHEREILWFNRRAAELLNLRRSADLGLRIDNLLRHPSFAGYLSDPESSRGIVIRPKVVEDVWLMFQAMPFGEKQTMLLVRDVSREERIDAMRRDFVANASHELRSPLTVIAGYLETLAGDTAIDPTLRGPLEEMRRQSQRMTAIIDDLLELSRLEASDEQVKGEPVNVPGMIASLRKDALAREHHPSEISAEVDASLWLIGDAGLIQSALSNLVDNAAKYTPDVGRVALRWWRDSAGAHFSVADTGSGIAAEHIPRLTERFYRADPGRSRQTGGSGLGLAIVKHVLHRHGAELEIRSVQGQGSTFTCHFPEARATTALAKSVVAPERIRA